MVEPCLRNAVSLDGPEGNTVLKNTDINGSELKSDSEDSLDYPN